MRIDDHDILYPRTAPFVLIHLACLAVIWTGVTPQAIAMAVPLYFVRMFGVTAGYHRYFSHRAFRTSRWFQWALAFLAQTSTQKGVLWWAAAHRHHHRHSDTEIDLHSPRRHGFLYAHFLWVFSSQHRDLPEGAVPDLVKFPELMFLERFNQLPSTALAIVTLLVAGGPGLVVGFCCSTVCLYHTTFAINSLAHAWGTQRYDTGDESRNNWWLAVITLGEGWHNNHHAYQRSARQGFRWYEIDVTFYILTILSWTGLVWDLGVPPRSIVHAVAKHPVVAASPVPQQLRDAARI
jgi:stearoyl-CoA desaturase (delta-9 desaturase)